MAASARVPFRGDQHMLAESGKRMTTDRTAIRRRLAVRRTAHRPPWRGRKTGHRPIVAPLTSRVAATLAASVAVGVGVALAKAELDRRAARDRRAGDRHFGLLAGERPGDGLRRMALGQLDLALELLGGEDGRRPDERAVHETRKALKRLRAMVRLARHQLGAQASARESTALREAGRCLAGARDAEVMVFTLEGLLKRHPRKLARRGGLIGLHQQLVFERERAQARALGDIAARAEVLSELRAARARIADWRLPDGAAIDALEPGLGRLYRRGRSRYRRAARGKGDRGRALHQWRKRVKDLRYAAEMLDRREPTDGAGGKRHRSARGRGGEPRAAARLRKIARRADELGEMLGEEHDLAMLAARLDGRGGPAATIHLGRGTRRALLKLIAKRRRKLRTQALRDGARLYGRRPKRFLARVHQTQRRASISRR